MVNSPLPAVSEPAILVPLIVISLAVMLWRLHRGRRFTWPRTVVGVIACVYGAAVVREVLLPLPAAADPAPDRVSWDAFINLTPLVNTEFAADMVPNILLFLPLGVLLPLLARVRSAWLAVLVGFLFSLLIETTQFVADVTLNAEHAADVNDLLANTVGALIGYALFRLAVHLPPLARLATALTWPAPASSLRKERVARTTGLPHDR